MEDDIMTSGRCMLTPRPMMVRMSEGMLVMSWTNKHSFFSSGSQSLPPVTMMSGLELLELRN